MFSFSPMSSWASAKELRAWRRHVSNFTLLNFGQKMGIRVKGQTFYVYMTLLLSSPSKNWLVLVANHMARIFYGFFKGSSEDPPPITRFAFSDFIRPHTSVPCFYCPFQQSSNKMAGAWLTPQCLLGLQEIMHFWHSPTPTSFSFLSFLLR